VVVTHRPHVMQMADEILVLHEGRVVARGPYSTLIRTGALSHSTVPHA
jgi:ABC-type multidrug transport system fused ATPase/permease subunit